MIAATDFKGRPGRDADIVAHGSRLDESNYVELTLRRDDSWSKTESATRLVSTVAFANPVFHYNGEFNVKMAIRNLYIEERDLGLKGLSVWAGSRMYRGDDIYLLDFWPLDNLNTMGAGARYDFGKTYAALQSGFSMPRTPFYFQEAQRPPVFGQVGSTTVDILERQRLIGSLKVSHTLPLRCGGGVKAIGYAELHRVPSGQRETLPRVFEHLPSEGGFVIGTELGGFTGKRNSHVNLVLRYATGLAAYGEFATPDQPGPDGTSGAHELLVALGGNWETGPLGVMFGGYFRSFRNASKDLDFGDVDEGILVARPHFFFGDIGGVALEASYQVARRGVVTLTDADNKPPLATGPFTASLFRVGLVPFLSPAGRGDYSRPQFRLIYLLTPRGTNARKLYPQDDVFSLRSVEHFFGVGAEWWFNETTYGG
jgi:maltoporin